MKDPAVHPLRASVSVLSIVLLLNQSLLAQAPSATRSPAAAPSLPAQIRTSQKVFLANSGAQTGFPYDSTVAYQQSSDDLQAWGRYTLVGTPAEADLVFGLRSAAPIGGVDIDHGYGGSYRLPTLELTITDPHTNTHLWVLSEPVYTPVSRKDKTDWFTLAVTNLTTKVRQLAGVPVTAAELAELDQTPKAPHHRWIYAAIVIPVVAGVAGGLILHHEYENSLSNQKTQQDAFCQANNIPLAQCAGSQGAQLRPRLDSGKRAEAVHHPLFLYPSF